MKSDAAHLGNKCWSCWKTTSQIVDLQEIFDVKFSKWDHIYLNIKNLQENLADFIFYR